MKTLHRFRFVLLAVTAVILVAATVYTYTSSGSSGEPAGHLGPTPGPSSEGHIRAQRAYLDSIATERPSERAAALVSLDAYIPASEAQSIARSLDATWVFLRFPDGEQELPQAVRTSITDALRERADAVQRDIAAEIASLTDQAKAATGAERAELEGLIAQRERELAAAKADCACVFAFAVEGASLAALKELADRPGVRLVDVPEPVTRDLGGWELQPIVPRTDDA